MKLRILVKRNISVFLSNKAVVLLTFASICVVISLYALFLRDFMTDVVLSGGVKDSYVDLFTDRMMLAGLFPVITTTTSFGMLHIYVRDSETGIKRDFLTAPLSPFLLTVSYWISSGVVSSFFSLITFSASEIFFKCEYSSPLEPKEFIEIVLAITASAVINSAIVLIFAKSVNTVGAFLTFANLYGTLVGFLAGSYLPYYFYPQWLKKAALFYPPFQLVSVCRQFAVENIKADCFSFPENVSNKFFTDMGITLRLNGSDVSLKTQLILICAALIFLIFILALTDMSRNRAKSMVQKFSLRK